MRKPSCKLSNRLLMCANNVREHAVLLDIGTDHAYLPTYLLLNNKIKSAIATDIHQKPLQNAKKTLEKFNVQNKVTLIQSNGFEKVSLDNVTDITIAGMGGTLIKEILEKADFNMSNNLRLILQPMSMPEEARQFLFKNHFKIIKEEVIAEDKRLYLCICAQQTDEDITFTDYDCYVGKLLENSTKEANTFLLETIRQLEIRYNALQKSNRGLEEQKKLKNILERFKKER